MNALWTSMWYRSSWSRDGLRNQLCGRLKNTCTKTNINIGTFAIKDLTANGSSSRYLQDSNSNIQFDVTGKLAATDREQKGKCVTSTLHTGDVALKGTTYRDNLWCCSSSHLQFSQLAVPSSSSLSRDCALQKDIIVP